MSLEVALNRVALATLVTSAAKISSRILKFVYSLQSAQAFYWTADIIRDVCCSASCEL